MQRILEGKVVVVTGASSGIGKASSLLFAEQGAKVVLADIDEENGRKVLDMVRQRGEAIFIKTDVSKSEDAKRCIESAASHFGKLDCLFSNAGINPTGTVVDTDEDLWETVINVNLKGTFLMCKYAIPEMKKNGKGSIVCTASVDAVLAIQNEAAYIASKGGIVSLVKAMALDHAKEGIRVNCILPGAIRTPLYEKFLKENTALTGLDKDPFAEKHALGRIGEPEEVASVVSFLLSDLSSFVTGAIIPVDGGYSAVKI